MGCLKWNRLTHRRFRVRFRVRFHGTGTQLIQNTTDRRKGWDGRQAGQMLGATPVPGPLARPRNPLRRPASASGVAPDFCAVPRPENFCGRLASRRPHGFNFTQEGNPSGNTTILNALAKFIDPGDRIIFSEVRA